MSKEDDKFAVAVYEELGFDELRIVGHLSAEFSRTVAYFIENDGEISCKVGKRKHSRPTRRKSLVLPKGGPITPDGILKGKGPLNQLKSSGL